MMWGYLISVGLISYVIWAEEYERKKWKRIEARRNAGDNIPEP